MLRAVDHLVTHRSAGLPLKPGGRKTSITLRAFDLLRSHGQVRTMLVIAPLRVCRQVWRQEGAKWTEFRHLTFALLHGSKKDAALRSGADVYLINPEGVKWLCKQYPGRQLPFDIVTIDELTKFKNHQSDRSKVLRPRIERIMWKWGLTGSLAPNGYLDLFGQQLMLDNGAALGKYITHYRDSYFTCGFDGFTYDLMPGAPARITAKLAPYWFAIAESEYSQLPPLVDNPIMLELAPPERKLYNDMKRSLLAELPEGTVTAANQAACYSKLSQMANGAVYIDLPGGRVTSHIHDIKLEAIEELLEELNGEPLLVGYEFNSDLDRLRERFGVVDPVTGKKVIPYLGKGTTAAQEDSWIRAWNRGELPLLCAHPASAGHGLNMQEGSAYNVAWFGITWDFELYDQFIRRIMRSGTKAAQIFNHLLIVRGTIDELKLEALRGKDMTQTGLLRALNNAISREQAETQGAGDTGPNDDRRLPTMVARLSTQAGPATAAPVHHAPAAAPAAQEQPVRPAGWGKPPADGAGAPVHTDQRERIQDQIAPAPAEAARAAFSAPVAAATEAVRSMDYGATTGDAHPALAAAAAPAPTTRRRAAPAAAAAPAADPRQQSMVPALDLTVLAQAIEHAGIMHARATVMQGVIVSGPDMSVAEIVETTRELMDFIVRG